MSKESKRLQYAMDILNGSNPIDKTYSYDINILGRDYTVKIKSSEEDELLNDWDGYCDWTSANIVIDKCDGKDVGNIREYIKHILTHEITHACLHESGMDDYNDERFAEWVACMVEKIHDIVTTAMEKHEKYVCELEEGECNGL